MRTIRALLAVSLVVSACSSVRTSSISQDDGAPSAAASANAFSLALFRQTAQTEKETVFLSPLSVSMALNMVAIGAEGDTKKELEATIASTAQMPQDSLLKIAYSLWIKPDFQVKQSYIEACAPYRAEVYNQAVSADDINSWAALKTNNKITHVLSDPLRDYRMMIVNALYFKADWASPFNEAFTRKELFHPLHGEPYLVPMMHKTANYGYNQTDYAQILEINYRGGQYAMDIILPNENLTEVLKHMTEEEYIAVLPGSTERVALTMPKIKLSYERRLNEDLQAVGIKRIFTAKAELGGISEEKTFVSLVKQNTFLSVDEQGTEAAAVTTIGLRATAFRPEKEPIPFVVDKPFIVLIRQTQTNTILFLGKITQI